MICCSWPELTEELRLAEVDCCQKIGDENFRTSGWLFSSFCLKRRFKIFGLFLVVHSLKHFGCKWNPWNPWDPTAANSLNHEIWWRRFDGLGCTAGFCSFRKIIESLSEHFHETFHKGKLGNSAARHIFQNLALLFSVQFMAIFDGKIRRSPPYKSPRVFIYLLCQYGWAHFPGPSPFWRWAVEVF